MQTNRNEIKKPEAKVKDINFAECWNPWLLKI